MKVAWINPNEPEQSEGRDKIKCDVCGKSGLPFKPWTLRTVQVGWTEHGYEAQVWSCSEKCDKKIQPILKLKRQQLNKEFAEAHGITISKWYKEIIE